MIRHLLLSEDNSINAFVNEATDKTIEVNVSDEKFNELFDKGLSLWKYENGKFVFQQEQINKANLQEEYFQIKGWLRENDWKFNKVFIGEWADTDPRWVEYKEQRVIKRERLDKIKEALGI